MFFNFLEQFPFNLSFFFLSTTFFNSNMNHCVPDFDIYDQDHPKKHPMGDEDTMELLWQNGQVVMQSQNHRHIRKPPHPPPARISGTSIRPEVVNYSNNNNNNENLFMQEDEMTSWLHHCPIDYDDQQTFCDDLLFSPPPPPVNANNNNSAMQILAQNSQMTELRQSQKPVAPRPPIPPPRRTEIAVRANTPNFAYFSKQNIRTEPGPSSNSRNGARESTMVDSCETPFLVSEAAVSRFSEPTEGDGIGGRSMSATTTSGGGGKDTATFGMTSSPGGSSSSGEMNRELMVADRKRKGRVEAEEWESRNEDVDFESAEEKKQVRGSSTKRSRAAEVHNLSERKRRDRINEKMRALQELIPRCNKSDKASMLDEAIEYLKSLQLQVQMMSMGCGMVPMMFAGMQPYMPAMGMGMGMNRHMMPFPNMLTGSALPTTTPHLGPRFPMPPFHMPHVPAPDSSRTQGMNQSNNNMPNSVALPVPNQSYIPNITDPYQQYLAPHQMQFQLMQNQAMNQVNVSKPSTGTAPEKPEENHQSD